MCMCAVYVFMCLCEWVHVCVCLCVYVCASAYVVACVFTCLCECVHVYVCYVWLCVCVHLTKIHGREAHQTARAAGQSRVNKHAIGTVERMAEIIRPHPHHGSCAQRLLVSAVDMCLDNHTLELGAVGAIVGVAVAVVAAGGTHELGPLVRRGGCEKKRQRRHHFRVILRVLQHPRQERLQPRLPHICDVAYAAAPNVLLRRQLWQGFRLLHGGQHAIDGGLQCIKLSVSPPDHIDFFGGVLDLDSINIVLSAIPSLFKPVNRDVHNLRLFHHTKFRKQRCYTTTIPCASKSTIVVRMKADLQPSSGEFGTVAMLYPNLI
eukprot:m.214118 g.214118  ORF g.214118 m.214118 type:complete len:320 (+) comp19070_c0_seq1:1604-2563(+)